MRLQGWSVDSCATVKMGAVKRGGTDRLLSVVGVDRIKVCSRFA